MRKCFARFLVSLGLLAAPAMAAPLGYNVIYAHPVLWHIKGVRGTVTLFGSLHILPANMNWLTPEIVRALRQSDVFVFEVPTDASARDTLDGLIASNGALPSGQSLRALLPPDSLAQYDAAITAAHLSPAVTDYEQPWLVSLQLNLADTMNRNYFPDDGADYVLMSWANEHFRRVRYLETVDQQFTLLDEAIPLDEFETGLKTRDETRDSVGPLVMAWSDGDMTRLGSLMDANFIRHPESKKKLLSDRNIKWAKQIEEMMKDGQDYFITVGAAHLAGPDGVPALLRADGYAVDGP